jgi:TonB family protein
MASRLPDDLEPKFLVDWCATYQPRRRVFPGLGLSVLLHLSVVLIALAAPRSFWHAVTPHRLAEIRILTPLVAPPFELTQKAPNRGRIAKEIDYESLLPRPRLVVPPTPPSTPGSGRQAPAPPPLPEPPRIEAAANQPAPALGQPDAPAAPPPRIQPEETTKPKLAFETPAAMAGTPRGLGRAPAPAASVDEAIRAAARQSRTGGIVVGDLGDGPGGIGEAVNLPGAQGRQSSAVELLSDPLGVDFRPYLTQILASVRRNWFAVIPESAKLGRGGRVQIQFSISRDGRVPKLVIASPSGADALDRAAVAGISASNPFPPLPSEFRGSEVRLQFTFLYNQPRRSP